MKFRIFATILLILSAWLGFSLYNAQQNGEEFSYGLDLSGGSHLVYHADVENVDPEEVDETLDILRRTIEKRVNLFGVSEPVVQVEKGSIFSSDEDQNRLIVELPGVTDLNEALRTIGETPLLEFKLLKESEVFDENEEITEEQLLNSFEDTGLTGGQLKRASLVFDHTTAQPIVTLEFNDDGSDLFRSITAENVGNIMAIFLDGEVISAPFIRTEIAGGVAQIDGQFTPEEARDLVNNLNFGALPVPIELISSQTIGASLGSDVLAKGINSLMISMGLIFIYVILFYRLPGIVAAVSLITYLFIMLALFKFIPVVLTVPGIAGLILSIGMTVDANILIFERLKEELDSGKSLIDAIKDGFSRAWPSIRDGNISSLLAAAILYWFSDTSLVKGFALVFAIGVLVSMISAVLVSRTFLLAISKQKLGPIGRFLYSKGLTNVKKN
jgi:preprotein translocase subunit SecD